METETSILCFLADWRLALMLVVLAVLVFGAAVIGAILIMFRGE